MKKELLSPLPEFVDSFEKGKISNLYKSKESAQKHSDMIKRKTSILGGYGLYFFIFGLLLAALLENPFDYGEASAVVLIIMFAVYFFSVFLVDNRELKIKEYLGSLKWFYGEVLNKEDLYKKIRDWTEEEQDLARSNLKYIIENQGFITPFQLSVVKHNTKTKIKEKNENEILKEMNQYFSQ